MNARAIGVFDSGTGGLTVLHECLVTMPHEDFVYLGDHARLPYGPRPLGDDPFGAETTAAVREYAKPLKDAGIDTVILGCTHYPLIRPVFQRVFGRGVTLVFSAEETAREVAGTLDRKGIENEEAREGSYRFLTTGDPEAFRALGQRFLQLPIAEVEHVELAKLRREARPPRRFRRRLAAVAALPPLAAQNPPWDEKATRRGAANESGCGAGARRAAAAG